MAYSAVGSAANVAPAPPGCEVRAAIPPKGLGLFSSVPQAVGAQVFVEDPLFVLQHTGNRRVVAACANCCACLGSIKTQLETLFGEARFAPLHAELAEVLPAWQAQLLAAYGYSNSLSTGDTDAFAVRCAQGCGEVYCSESCRAKHFAHSHNLLCVGPIDSENHPLVRFKYHAVEHTDTLLLAAQALANIVNRAKAAGGGALATRGLMSELLGFCHAPFRDACRAPPGRAKDAEFYTHVDQVVYEAAALLKAAFEVHAPEEAGALFEAGPALLSELLGLFEFNNIDVEIPSTLGPFLTSRARALFAASSAGDARAIPELRLLERMLREKEWVMRCVWGEATTGIYGDDGAMEGGQGDEGDAAMTEDGVGDEAAVVNASVTKARSQVDCMSFEKLIDAVWPAFHGTALFVSAARINHSCAPNLKVSFPGNGACLSTQALAPVAPGDELCISYILDEADATVRRRQLLEYGFVCNCERCRQEDSGNVRKEHKRLK